MCVTCSGGCVRRWSGRLHHNSLNTRQFSQAAAYRPDPPPHTGSRANLPRPAPLPPRLAAGQQARGGAVEARPDYCGSWCGEQCDGLHTAPHNGVNMSVSRRPPQEIGRQPAATSVRPVQPARQSFLTLCLLKIHSLNWVSRLFVVST